MFSRRAWILAFFFVTACASSGNGPGLASDQSFGVPTELADKFSVKEKKEGIPVDAKASAPAPKEVAAAPAKEPTPAKGKKSVKGKLAKSKWGKKGKPEVTKAAPPPPPKDFENRWTTTPFFTEGEKYKFDITYFGATAGSLELELLAPKVVDDRPSYHIRAIARTVAPFTLFYRLNDVAESYLDTESLFTHKFTLKMDESLQERDILELYDQRAHKVYYWSKLDHKKKGKKNEQFEVDAAPYSQDSVSSFYYLRTLPLEVGKVFEFPVMNNGKPRTVRATVVRKEEIKTRIGTFDAFVVKPEVVLDGAISTYGDSFVWISADPRRILLKVDAKIKVGSVIAYLREHSYGPGRVTSGR